MKRTFSKLLALAVLALAALPSTALATAAQAEQLRPLNLRQWGGDGGWQAENDFGLIWNQPPIADGGFPVTAVNYRVHDASGAIVIPDVRLPATVNPIKGIRLPGPGIYLAAVWLEGPGGEPGPPGYILLHFDNVPPAPPKPLVPDGWLAAERPVLRFEHPTDPLPASGIRGYAFSVDRGGASAPCAGPDRCTLAETDRGGVGGDAVSLGSLPEGTNVVRVVAVSGAGLRSEARSVTVQVDVGLPEVGLVGAPAGWSNGPVLLTAVATDALSGVGAGDGAFTAIAIDGGLPKLAAGDTVAAVVTGAGIHSVSIYARDAAGNSGERAARMATVRIDETAPLVSFVNRQDPDEPERIEATVSDGLSGPDSLRGSIALRRVGSHERFAQLPTTVSAGRLVAHWDSDAFPHGTYEFRASGYDAAANAGVSERRADGTRMTLDNPLKAPTEVEAGFGGRRLAWNRCTGEPGRRRCRRQTVESFADRPRARTVPYGRGLSISGRVDLGPGAAAAGLPVEVIESFGAGAGLTRRVSTVLTAANGAFSSRLAPGPSRRVEALFAGDRLRSRSAAPSLRLQVLAGVRMHASAAAARVGGAPVVFSGRVGDLDAPIPAGGRPVELQFRVPGGEWSGFRTVQTDAHGRFRYPYSFSDDDSRGVRFQFRAYAAAVDGWPYEPAVSAPVFVTGR